MSGLMAKNMKENSVMTNNKDLGLVIILMVKFLKASG